MEIVENNASPAPEQNGSYEIPPPPAPLKAITAFLVVYTPDGGFQGFNDVTVPLELERAATINDMTAGCAQVMRDAEIMLITNNVVQNLINAQMQIAEQAQTQKLAAKLASKGIHLPH